MLRLSKKVAFVLCLSVSASLVLAGESLLNKVDQYIGTGGHGHTFVGPTVPFGAIQPGPVNVYRGWDWSSCYHYSTKSLIGFGQLHLSGTGCTDLGDILIMPFTGKSSLEDSSVKNAENGHVGSSEYSHDNEVARPDYYSVVLDRSKTKVEIAATERAAIYRLSYPKSTDSKLFIDLVHGNCDTHTESYIRKIDDNTFVGYRYSKGWANDQRVFFALKFNCPLKDYVIYNNKVKVDGDTVTGRVKTELLFDNADKPVLVKLAISPVSTENAMANLEAELNHWDFQKVVDDAAKVWEKELAKIKIEGLSDSDETVFYTAMYHSMISPVLFNDHNGDYRGTDKKVYTNPGFNNYSIFSLWDTYRTQHPLLTFYQPERINDMVNSMLAIYQQQGYLPIWHLMGCETGTMVGYHAVPPVVDAYLKGFDGFDAELAFQAVKDSAMNDMEGVKFLKEKGYIPCDWEGEAVAKSLEYAIDDSCIALMAKKMGKTDDYKYFMDRSMVYSKYFDKDIQFMRGRMADGSWRTPFDPISAKHRSNDYCEGNAWQYTWLVPHDPHGLIELFGSDKAYTDKMDKLFTMSSELQEGASSDISGLIGQYAHGNEPSHHTIYMYAFAGQQWKSAKYVRQVLDTLYTDKRDGLSGNEDCGQMSAWYIMSSFGFYPVHPANGVYVFGSPGVKKAELSLPGGKTFKVIASNNSDDNIYIQSVKYNGKAYDKAYITYDMISSGGTLEFEMGSTPNTKFGSAESARP